MAKVQLADAVKDKTPYEEFMVAKYLAFISVSREPQDLAAAHVAVNRQIASGGAPEPEKPNMYSMGMLLNYANMDYAKVVQSAQELQKLNQPLNEQQTVVLVQSYYNTMDYQNAAKEAKAVSDAKIAAGEKPSAGCVGPLAELAGQADGRRGLPRHAGPARHRVHPAGSVGSDHGLRPRPPRTSGNTIS